MRERLLTPNGWNGPVRATSAPPNNPARGLGLSKRYPRSFMSVNGRSENSGNSLTQPTSQLSLPTTPLFVADPQANHSRPPGPIAMSPRPWSPRAGKPPTTSRCVPSYLNAVITPIPFSSRREQKIVLSLETAIPPSGP
jgi:hypothetical protein